MVMITIIIIDTTKKQDNFHTDSNRSSEVLLLEPHRLFLGQRKLRGHLSIHGEHDVVGVVGLDNDDGDDVGNEDGPCSLSER